MATDTDRVRIMLAAKERRGVDEEQQAEIDRVRIMLDAKDRRAGR